MILINQILIHTNKRRILCENIIENPCLLTDLPNNKISTFEFQNYLDSSLSERNYYINALTYVKRNNPMINNLLIFNHDPIVFIDSINYQYFYEYFNLICECESA